MVRAYLQEALYAKERVSKLFTIGPMFRHERPQKGRFREFHQIDAEVFGTDDPLVDAELLWLISLILNDLQIADYKMEVNSVGCKQCRQSFRDVLVLYYQDRKDHLCEDCSRRLEKNPLRIFDCKNIGCIELTQSSPILFDYLCTGCREHFDLFLKYAGELGAKVVTNKRLVRGLDYYTKTVFEVTSEDLGAQKAFIAGGRYNNLVEEMGGSSIPGIGFAIGVERLALLTKFDKKRKKPLYFFAYVGDKAKVYLTDIVKSFLKEGMSLGYSYEGKSLKSQMRYADSLNADFVLILGDDEIERNIIILRNMSNKNQHELPLDLPSLIKEIQRLTLE